MDEFLSRVFADQWRVILGVSGILLAVGEIGFRLGLRLHRNGDEARKTQIPTIHGAMLGMLGLLLGFTFAMAVARYDARRILVLEEANAIRTTFRLASLLREPDRVDAENLLRRYVDARLAFYEAGNDPEKVDAAQQVSIDLQKQLWARVVAGGKAEPSALLARLVSALNEMIDLDARRLAAYRNTVPGVVWLLVIVVASCGCWASGYGTGSSGKRALFATVVLPLLIAVVITLVADIDRPRRGLIEVSQQSLIDVKQFIGPAES